MKSNSKQSAVLYVVANLSIGNTRAEDVRSAVARVCSL